MRHARHELVDDARNPDRRLWTLALVVLAQISLAGPANAQCPSTASSCTTCHEVQGQRPVSAQAWHVDHGFGDLCASCHAGDPGAPDKAHAHVGLRHPLSDPIAACASCHADDHVQRAERYRTIGAAVPPVTGQGPPAASAPAGRMADRVLALVAGLLCLPLFVVIRRHLREPRRPIKAGLRDKLWSPYVAGGLLGLVVAFSEVICGRPIAASGAFDKLAAYVGSWLFPDSQYYAHIMTPGITWQVWLIVGVLGGSFASSKLAGEARLRWLPDTQWQPRFGASRWRRFALAFCGAVLVQIGAGIAGGCTSGLAISGGAVLAPAAFLFMAGMFAGGIPTAWLWYRGRAD